MKRVVYEESVQSRIMDPGNDFRARAVVDVITDFLEDLHQRAGREHLSSVIRNDKTVLSGRKVHQKPERYTEDALIWPMLNALGHTHLPQPKWLGGIDARIPDFRLKGLEWTVIGEVKIPNQIGDARSDSLNYLRRLDDQPAGGIATDGLTWILYVSEDGSTPVVEKQSPLRPMFKLLKQEHTSKRDTRKSRLNLRENLYDFVSTFSKESLIAGPPE